MLGSLRKVCFQRSLNSRSRCQGVRGGSQCYALSPATAHNPSLLRSVNNATFYRQYASAGTESMPPLSSGLFSHVDAEDSGSHQWAVISPSSATRTTFLQTLAGQHVVSPPTARKYPALSRAGITPHHAIKYVGFDADRGDRIGGSSLRGAYLSARYESRRESTDFSLKDYLSGNTELNGVEKEIDSAALEEVIEMLNLTTLSDMPVSNLSNGQTRRARIAKALMERPRILLLDGPFMGLDPRAVVSVSQVLGVLAERGQPRLVISLRPQDSIPEWIDSLLVLSEQNSILAQGGKETVLRTPGVKQVLHNSRSDASSRATPQSSSSQLQLGEALIEMNGVKVSYGDKVVLGDWSQQYDGEERQGLWWALHRGQRCGIFGSNGSGKTTMLSLITSDHPQTYGLPVKIFGRSRLPELGVPGISVFDLHKRMGHSSPEVHAYFPKQLTVRRALQSAWADAPLARPVLDEQAKAITHGFLQAFAAELFAEAKTQPARADQIRFGELSFSSQRLLLFLRAIITQPDLILLDEAFSGIDEATRDKAFVFLAGGHAALPLEERASDAATFTGLAERQALLVVSHAKEDVPDSVREWIRLPDPGDRTAPTTGVLSASLREDASGWDQIWDT